MMPTRAQARRLMRRAANVGNTHPGVAARFYDQASVAWSQLHDHTAAREAAEAAEAHRNVARGRAARNRRATA